MKLNDPFGRMEKRHQANYEMMRDAMLRGSIGTVEAAQDIIKKSKNRSLKFLSVALAVLLLILCLFPNLMPALVCLAVIVTLWIVNSIISGKRYVERYINEELHGRTKEQDHSTQV
jgi:membrane protein required for beta-lactamase induction